MSVVEPHRVLCLSGSLRRVSANTAVLEAASILAPPGLTLALYRGMGQLPLFNPDQEVEPLPRTVVDVRGAVENCDALLIACPEYAHGVPGPFKNLLDWLVGSLGFPGKPVALINTSGRGSRHAQAALREILRTMSAQLLDEVSCTVPTAGAGCTEAQVLSQPERCRELTLMLGALQQALGRL